MGKYLLNDNKYNNASEETVHKEIVSTEATLTQPSILIVFSLIPHYITVK